MSGLTIEGLSVTGPSRPRLNRLSLAVGPGECVFLVGPNGAGKSTLLKAVLGLERASAGRVLLQGHDVTRLTARERAGYAAWLPQQWAFDQALTASEVVAIARYRFRESEARAVARARDWLSQVGANDLAERRVTELSGGEQQRIKLAALLAQEAPLLLVDEPANHLDPAQQIEVYQTLAAQWQRGLGMLCVTHDINLVSVVGRPRDVRLLGIQNGRTYFDTRMSDPDLAQKLGGLYGIDFDRIERKSGRPGQPEHGGTGALFVPGLPSLDPPESS